jgi:hypothetical protein
MLRDTTVQATRQRGPDAKNAFAASIWRHIAVRFLFGTVWRKWGVLVFAVGYRSGYACHPTVFPVAKHYPQISPNLAISPTKKSLLHGAGWHSRPGSAFSWFLLWLSLLAVCYRTFDVPALLVARLGSSVVEACRVER